MPRWLALHISTVGNNQIRIGIFYTADPLGMIPGGIETFIRGIVRWAPDDLEINVVGVTTDPVARPVGKWTVCDLGRGKFNHLPVYEIKDPGKQARIPTTIKYMIFLARWVYRLRSRFDVLEFHRIEPVAMFLFDKTPKNAFFHQNMEVLHDKSSDIRWKYMPWLYFIIEKFLLHRLHSIFAVREDAVKTYQERYPEIAERFRFTPTWMDPDIFYPPTPEEYRALREELLVRKGISRDNLVMISVGRLDTQKDPLLMLNAFSEICRIKPASCLVIIGDGVLLSSVKSRIRELGLEEKVLMTGLLEAAKVAKYLRAADLFVLSSVYEGMPMCVLEAMGCGLPVATTDVGEVRRVVRPGRNGEITKNRTIKGLTEAILLCIDNIEKYRGKPSLEIAAEYVPEKILAPIYDNYRHLALARKART